MQGGKLRFKLRITQPVEVEVDGRLTTIWQTVGEIFAAVQPLSGREIQNPIQTQASTMHSISCRYTDLINPKSVLVLEDTRQLGVVEIIDINNRHKELKIIAYEVLE